MAKVRLHAVVDFMDPHDESTGRCDYELVVELAVMPRNNEAIAGFVFGGSLEPNLIVRAAQEKFVLICQGIFHVPDGAPIILCQLLAWRRSPGLMGLIGDLPRLPSEEEVASMFRTWQRVRRVTGKEMEVECQPEDGNV